jgi:hypothetical protein
MDERGEVEDMDIYTLGMFLLYHSMAHMESEASPGIVVDADIAARTPCKCARAGESEICFSRGIVGGLDAGQKEAFCNPKMYFESPGLEQRIGEFNEAVVAAQEIIKDVPKGERLQPWLSAMSEELGKRGIGVADSKPGYPEVDIRKDYDEMAEVKGGTLYRKGGTIQVWWGPGWGKETWSSDVENAKRNFIDMRERWS